MTHRTRTFASFGAMAFLLALVGWFQSWSLALSIVNMSLISAIMALGVNIQWGYTGLLNIGTMGFAALGGLAVVLISMPPVMGAWEVGGTGLFLAGLSVIVAVLLLFRSRLTGKNRTAATLGVVAVGYFAVRYFGDPAIGAIENFDASRYGYVGGLGLPLPLAWIAGGLLAGAAAWMVGKAAFGLRSDYLAIATLGIAEIIMAMLRNEAWLTRGVMNIPDIPKLTVTEIELQAAPWFNELAQYLALDPISLANVFVKLIYTAIFILVLVVLYWFAERAFRSPWGRMMRAIRDNRDAAEAMGKDVTGRNLQILVLGSAVVGIAGAMLVTLDGQFNPVNYTPLRYTFLIWVMVIVGGAGSNLGSVIGAFLIWFVWVQAEPVAGWLISNLTSAMGPDNPIRVRLLDSAAHLRLIVMGVVLLLVMRFSPGGVIPERR